MQNLAPILQAIASILWVGFAFTALLFFKPEISQILSRFKKGKFLGQEVELTEDLEKLANSVNTVAEEIQEIPLETKTIQEVNKINAIDDAINEILKQTAISPKTALMLLQAEIEKQARQAVAMRGLLNGRRTVPMKQALKELVRYGFPANMVGSLELFSDVRNKIIHGHSATNDNIIQAIDSGITILKAINALPSEKNIVYHSGVPIFSDEFCKSEMKDVKGVVLETISAGGTMKSFRIFPTTRKHFEKGKHVAWEWNLEKTWADAWYKDPDTGEIRNAWGFSAEFIGRHLEDI